MSAEKGKVISDSILTHH